MHLFLHCSVTRAFWLASPWSIKLENHPVDDLDALLNILIDLSAALLVHTEDSTIFFLFVALTFDSSWKLQNSFLFEGKKPILEEEVRVLFKRFAEHKKVLSLNPTHSPIPREMALTAWSPPLLEFIKINCDASIKGGFYGYWSSHEEPQGQNNYD